MILYVVNEDPDQTDDACDMDVQLQSNFDGSNIFGTMEICSKHG